MTGTFRFETPENVQVHYEPAGLGTRFVAWFVDQVLVWVLSIALIVVLMVTGSAFDIALDEYRPTTGEPRQVVLYTVGLMMLLWGLGSFAYFGGCEFLFRGQTVGKRMSQIRVVKVDGFQLDATSILVRNVFRVVDHLPPMWLVPFLSRLSQRAGDMVAGTIVVHDAPVELSPVRAALGERATTEARFRFDATALKRLKASDFEAVERLLARLPRTAVEQRTQLLEAFSRQLAAKLECEAPAAELRLVFLEDLLAAELRRQQRNYA
jgi:uncharacterized RDD family membrane protein YckC